ncbi:polysaccharide biosynthesis protein GumN [Paenibacillus sp. CAA11]|uniref:TraB/GumN family protein n=1 Tax=Paenibacillus sp. CAA11 TaxID=1532905 RepID=UPI000D3BF7C6|nr:TraB/GumN family protein [Paenibacillus sp. CAA11]AWB43275.1 polysaccharide biosynthesis protein GumN [Paenibacillus sp. CAA11]
MKTWKKSLLSLMISSSMLMAAVPAMAASAPIPQQQPVLKVDNKQVDFASEALVVDQGTTLVPLQTTFKALNVGLTDVKDGTVHAVVNGKEITLSSKAKVINGVTYVPIRILGDAAGYTVHWDQATRTVYLVSKATGTKQAARGFMWEVKNNGNTVYLVGSMHIADDSFYPLRSEIEDAFAEADYLGVEIDLSKAAGEEQQNLITKLGTYQDGTTLKDHVSEETYAKVGEILKKSGVKPDALDTYKPWVVETTISSLKSMKAGYEAGQGIDLYFIQKAIERKVPVVELESYASQLGMFDSFSKELQEKNLNTTLDNFDVLDEGVDQMADMWKSGDEKALLELTNSMAGDEEYNKAMLIDRNIGMADKIDGFLKSDKKVEYFVVVGAAHYLGEHGVIKLLEDKGYTVVRK